MRAVVIVSLVAGCGDDPCASQRISSAAATQATADATHVYWSEATELVRARKDGGGRESIATADGFGNGIVAVDGVVYWVGETAGAAAVMGNATALAPVNACPEYPNVAIASPGSAGARSTPEGSAESIDGDTVFTATFACAEAAPELVAVPRAGGEPVRTLLASGALRIVAGDGAAQLVVGDELVAIPAAGGEPIVLAQIIDADVIARDASEIFVATGSAVVAVPAAGGAAREIGRLAARPIAAIADGDRLFVVAAGALHVLPIAGGEPRELATTDTTTLGYDGTAVYRAESTGVVRTPTCAAD